MTLPMSETNLLQAVRDLAQLRGFLSYHTFRSDRSEPGFPDLVLVRHARLIFVELKSEQGRITVAQDRWLFALGECPVEVYLWRPEHLHDGTIQRTLAPRGGADG